MSSKPVVDVRPMSAADVEPASRAQVAAFDDLDRRLGLPPPTERSAQIWERIRARHHHFLTHDPAGCWVATADGAVIGCALALRRDLLWGLSLLVIDPAHQSSGAGRRLLDASLTYAEGCDLAIVLSSSDVRAMRSYATSGFELFPQVGATGAPSAIPAPSLRVRDGSLADAGLMDQVDVTARGAPHGPDHSQLDRFMQGFVVDDAAGRGYAWVRPDGDIALLAATDDITATDLLWRCLAHCHDLAVTATVSHLNAEQQWAISVCYAARLEVKPDGPVFWRGRTPPRCYLASGAYL